MDPSRSIATKAFVALAVLLAVALLGYHAWENQAAPNARREYRFERAERGSIEAVVHATGTLNAVETTRVAAQVSGQVKALFADYNTEVKRGQVIARIEPERFEFQVRQAQADLEATRTGLAVAEKNVLALRAELMRARAASAEALRDYERKRMLVEKGFIAPALGEQAQAAYNQSVEQVNAAEAQIGVQEAQVRNALANVKQRDARLAQARVDLSRTYIRAPADGIVISRAVDAGQTVTAGAEAEPLFTIAKDLHAMQVEAVVDEADIGRLKVGQPATFTVDAFPRRDFEGEVTQIRKVPRRVQNAVSYIVVIAAPNPDLALLPGMSAKVRIVTERRADVLRVPNAALRFRPPATKPESATTTLEPPPPRAVADNLRTRVAQDLKLDGAQVAKLDAILTEARAQADRASASATAPQPLESEQIWRNSRHRIAALLTAQQRAAFGRISRELEAGAGTSTGTIWVLAASGKPRPIEVRTGLSDGVDTEVQSDELPDGTPVIIGIAPDASAAVSSDTGEARDRKH